METSLLVSVPFAIFVLVDGLRRKLGVYAILFALLTLAIMPIGLPIYVAYRPLQPGKVRKGGKFWVFVKGFIAIFTVYMIAWALNGMLVTGENIATATSDAAAAGSTIGAGIGLTILCGVWLLPTLVLLVLGLVTRSDNIETGPTWTLA